MFALPIVQTGTSFYGPIYLSVCLSVRPSVWVFSHSSSLPVSACKHGRLFTFTTRVLLSSLRLGKKGRGCVIFFSLCLDSSSTDFENWHLALNFCLGTTLLLQHACGISTLMNVQERKKSRPIKFVKQIVAQALPSAQVVNYNVATTKLYKNGNFQLFCLFQSY